MSHFLVRGGRRLDGQLTVQGAKNSVLPILAATLLAKGQVVLLGCPRLRDVDASIRILHHLGCSARWEGDALTVDTAALDRCEISDQLMREMRSSAIFLGAILARCGQADLSYPGGCELGPRPIDLHLSGLRQLGAEIREEGGFLHCRAPALVGREVVLRMPSVGATENLMLAACGAEGTTVISNAAREPEIVDLQMFLNACGAFGLGYVAVEIRRLLYDDVHAGLAGICCLYVVAYAALDGNVGYKALHGLGIDARGVSHVGITVWVGVGARDVVHEFITVLDSHVSLLLSQLSFPRRLRRGYDGLLLFWRTSGSSPVQSTTAALGSERSERYPLWHKRLDRAAQHNPFSAN